MPPAIVIHRSGGAEEALRESGEVGLGEIEAEDHASAADPTEGNSLGAQVELEHPMISGRLWVEDGPHGGHVGHPDGEAGGGEAVVEIQCAGVPTGVEVPVEFECRGLLQVFQEHLHGGHDIGMRIEGSTGKADVRRVIHTEASHQVAPTAHHPDREPAAQGLAIGDDVGLDPEVFLGAAGRETEAEEDFVEDEDDSAEGADLPQLLQPSGIGGAIVAGVATAIHEGRVTGGRGVGVERLEGIDQYAGDVLPGAKDAQGGGVHFPQGITLVRGHRVARAGLDVVPPAVVGPAEPDNIFAAGVVTGEAHGLHHGLGSGHVEGDFILARDAAQPFRVPGRGGMKASEHESDAVGAAHGFGHAFLVEVMAQHIDPVRTGDIDEPLAIQVRQGHALAGFHESTELEMAAEMAAELEGNPVGAGELKIGNVPGGAGGHRGGFWVGAGEVFDQRPETGATTFHDGRGCVVGPEEFLFGERVAGQESRDAFGHPDVAGERRVFGPGKLQSPADAMDQIAGGNEGDQ